MPCMLLVRDIMENPTHSNQINPRKKLSLWLGERRTLHSINTNLTGQEANQFIQSSISDQIDLLCEFDDTGVTNYERGVFKYKNEIPKMSIYMQTNEEGFLKDLKAYITSHIDSDLLKVENMARHLHLSTSTLERRVKEITNMTPGKLVHEIRLDIAYKLISKRRDLSIHTIANKVGFKNASSFARSFKNKYGISPSSLMKH